MFIQGMGAIPNGCDAGDRMLQFRAVACLRTLPGETGSALTRSANTSM